MISVLRGQRIYDKALCTRETKQVCVCLGQNMGGLPTEVQAYILQRIEKLVSYLKGEKGVYILKATVLYDSCEN